MAGLEIDSLRGENISARLASIVPSRLGGLATHLAENIAKKIRDLESTDSVIEVLNPDWCREHSDLAGEMHAEIITGTYGTTYALPNKDPIANKEAIEEGDLDVYLMRVNGRLTGTACLVNTGDGRAELGRSASLGRSGNSIIQDYRILDWLTDEETSKKYHTLFTTLRSAPDRNVDGFIMRGGQAVTAHWRKMPELTVGGFGPLYLKHGSLEQFSCATLSRAIRQPDAPLYIDDEWVRSFIESWHSLYDNTSPNLMETSGSDVDLRFAAHYPPQESGLTSLVHADVVQSENGVTIDDAIELVHEAGSPFTQVVVPIDVNTRSVQQNLTERGFQAYAYEPSTTESVPALIYGEVGQGVSVVDTYWKRDSIPNPFWTSQALARYAAQVAERW